MIKSYKDLMVWQRAMTLARSTYKLTQAFPRTEMYGLTSQLRRCAVSIPSNIAEGHARASTAEFMRFLSIALGSLAEYETQLRIAEGLNYTAPNEADQQFKEADELGRMLRGLRQRLST